jgi:hypothetical protein
LGSRSSLLRRRGGLVLVEKRIAFAARSQSQETGQNNQRNTASNWKIGLHGGNPRFRLFAFEAGSGRKSSTLDEGKIEQADASRLNFLIPDPARPIFAPFVAIPGRRGRLEHLIIVAE